MEDLLAFAKAFGTSLEETERHVLSSWTRMQTVDSFAAAAFARFLVALRVRVERHY